MSVDANERHRGIRGYQISKQDGLEVLLSFALTRYAKHVDVDLKRSLFGKTLSVEVEATPHRHAPT